MELTKLSSVSKAELAIEQQKARETILNGMLNPLEVTATLKAMEDFVKFLRKDKEIKEAIEREADMYKEKIIDFAKFRITKTQRTIKDYSVCNDAVYNQMLIDLEKLKEAIKARECMLNTGFNADTGETNVKPLDKVTSVFKVELK